MMNDDTLYMCDSIYSIEAKIIVPRIRGEASSAKPLVRGTISQRR